MSRVLLILLAVLVSLVRGHAPLTLWEQWDGKWYLGIASHGYAWSIGGKAAEAFYPLYPLLIRLAATLGVPGILAGLLVANAAFLGALFYLSRLVAEDRGHEAARRATWLVSVLPTAFFFFAPYSESLFLLCALGATFHARRQEALGAGLWAAAAILTRPTGVIVLPAVLAALYLTQRERESERTVADIRHMAAAVLPSTVAVGAYLWYLSVQRIPFAKVAGAQLAWHRALTAPWTGFTASVNWAVAHGVRNVPWLIEDLLQLVVTILFLLLTGWAWRKMDWTSRVYCLGFWAVTLLSPEWRDGYYAPFSSMDRFVLVLFPIFGWVAAHLSDRRFRALVVASCTLMLAAATVHLVGGWVG